MTQSLLGTILLVCTSHEMLGDTGSKTGFWMEELTAPYYAFLDAGYSVTITSPYGGNPPVDLGSLGKNSRGQSVDRFEADSVAVSALSSSVPLSEIADMNIYAGVFLCGGHGTMWDYPNNIELSRIVAEAVAQSKTIGAVCHGVSGLLAGDVPTALRGKSVAGFSNEEEGAVGLSDVVPFLLETKLCEAGFNYSCSKMFTPHVVADGFLITGQNPMSSQATAEAMISVLANA